MNTVIKVFTIFWKALLVVLLLIQLSACSLFSAQKSEKTAPTKTDKSLIDDAQLRKQLKAERIVVEKSKRLMTVYALNKPIATYKVAIGREPLGPKTCEGDLRTPEGIYSVTEHRSKSRFYRALQFSYPNSSDIQRAKKQGCKPGHNLSIHGLGPERATAGKAHYTVDWTDGCIAVTDREMDELWKMVIKSTLIEIKP
jgi:murein L,D-transpeptidase YafK